MNGAGRDQKTNSGKMPAKRGVIRDILGIVSQALSGCVSFNEFFDTVRATLSPYIEHDAMGIYLYDDRTGAFRPLIHQTDEVIPEAVWRLHNLAPETTLKARAIREKKPFHTPDLSLADYGEAPLLREIGLGSHLVIPLFSWDRPRGVLYVVHRQTHIYDDFHVALLSNLTAPVALALEELIRLESSRALQQCGEDMAATLDVEQIFQRVAARLQPVLPHDVSCLFRIEEETGELASQPLVKHMPGIVLQEEKQCPDGAVKAMACVLKNGEPVLTGDLERDADRCGGSLALEGESIQSMMICRLEVADRPYGVFFMGDRRKDLYSRWDLEHFLWVGRQLSLALSNSIAFRKVEKLTKQLEEENLYLKNELSTQRNAEEVIGVSRAMQNVLEQVEMVASTDSTVLVTGETGTGKELVARAIHQFGSRSDKPLIRVNCAALPKELIESELFGHERGAFTGADRRRRGRFELAHTGTLFLDEVGDMTLEAQSRLLRALQEGEFERVGGEKPILVDVRVIAATNQNLDDAVSSGRFREDLFYRLQVFPIHVPPLRERPEDIVPLARHFALRAVARLKKPIRRLSQSSQREILRYDWPGNVRELEHMVERAAILARTDVLDMVPLIKAAARLERKRKRPFPKLEEMEQEHILSALEESGWRLAGEGGAAELLGLPRTTLQARMRKLGIERPPDR